MIGIKFVFLAFLWTLTSGDAEVSCVFMESCILPCRFQGDSDGDAFIEWTLMKEIQTSIHSYFSNQDQLTQQDEHFRGRTSLFKEQISKGNASLRLKWVVLQDEGRYKCSSRGNNDSFISLKVDAPVHEVNIEKVGNRITCSSEGIYPEPVLTWSTRHPSILKSATIVRQTRRLYSINSSLIPPDPKQDFTDITYSCTVSTRSNNKTAVLSNRSQNESIAKVMVAGVIMVAVILGLIPICCNKFNNKAPDPAGITNQPDVLLTEITHRNC